MPPQTTPKAINIEGISLEQALAVIQHRIASDPHVHPSTLANLQKLRGSLTEQPDRPMSSSDSPGMKAAREHTPAPYQHAQTNNARQGHAAKPEQPSPGQASAARATAQES